LYKCDQVAVRFTQRAEQLRTIAATVKDPEAREAMIRWADDYDRLAERAIELGPFGTTTTPVKLSQPAQPCRAQSA